MSKYSWHVAPSRQCEEIQAFRGLSSDWKIFRSTTDSCSAFLGRVACLVKSDAQGPHFHQRLGHEELNKSHPQHSRRTSPQRSHMLTNMGKSSGLYVTSIENRSMITLAVSTLPPLALGEGLASPPSGHGIRLWTLWTYVSATSSPCLCPWTAEHLFVQVLLSVLGQRQERHQRGDIDHI